MRTEKAHRPKSTIENNFVEEQSQREGSGSGIASVEFQSKQYHYGS